MPKGKNYKMGTVGKGGSRTPTSVMGSQGTPAKIPTNFNKTKPTKHSKFPG